MIAEVVYNGELRTTAKHLRSGTIIQTDAPIDNQGKGEAFSPTDLTSTSLAACILTIMGIAARHHKINMDGAKAEVHKKMVADPKRRIEQIKVVIHMPQNDYSDKEKKILERAAHHCPVGLSLHENTEEVVEIYW